MSHEFEEEQLELPLLMPRMLDIGSGLATARMQIMNIEQRVVEVLTKMPMIHCKEIDTAATLVSLGLDSLDKLELIMALETEFGIEVFDEDIKYLDSIPSIVLDIDRRLNVL